MVYYVLVSIHTFYVKLRNFHNQIKQINMTRNGMGATANNEAKIILVLINGVSITLKKSTHIKGRLLDQAVNIFNFVLLQNGTSLKGKN